MDFNPSEISNVIFDLGGVIIDLRRDLAVEAYQALGLKNADEYLGLYRQEEPFLGLETGRLTEAEFFEIMRPLCHGASDTAMADAFTRFLAGIPAERLERLLQLRGKGLKVFALSNTNPVMYNGWIARAFRSAGLSINDYFDGIVVSFQELTCKPDVEIFSRLLRRYGLEAGNTLMLDDSEANCEAARRAGMKAARIGLDPDNDMLALTSLLL